MASEAKLAQSRSDRSGKAVGWIIGTTLLLAVLLGVWLFGRYRQSEQHILLSLREFADRGKALSAEGCVGAVIDWSRRCRALESICLSSAPRLVGACLQGRERRRYCSGRSGFETHQSFRRCTQRGARQGLAKKVCASAYRTIDGFCRYRQAKLATPLGAN
ncbi:MAG: hypothetical protein H6707_04940 [Deltaproteobacteria bacterium]|nr:hypothetical protein [Deltaproteobacteria bacterium]